MSAPSLSASIAARQRLPMFATLGAMALLTLWGVTRTAVFARGSLVPAAVFFDLTVSLPLLYVFLVLRPAKRPLLDAAPVLAVGALIARTLLGARTEAKFLLPIGGALTEVAALTLLVRRVRGAARQLHEADGDDLLLRIATLTDPFLRVLGVELIALYYAFAGPFVRRPLRDGEFSYHETSGIGGLLVALGLVTAMEGLAAHFLLGAWSPRAAWAFAALNVYTLVWLAAAFQAARLRPVTVSPTRLLVRTSLVWSVEIPRATLASMTPIHDPSDSPREQGTLRAAFGAPPNLLLTLTTPVTARGLFGIKRSAARIALHVDDPEALRMALAP